MKKFIESKGINTDIVRLVLNGGYIDAEVVRPVKLSEVRNPELEPLRSEVLLEVPQDVLSELVGECPRGAKAEAFLAEAWQKAFAKLEK